MYGYTPNASDIDASLLISLHAVQDPLFTLQVSIPACNRLVLPAQIIIVVASRQTHTASQI